MLSKNLGPAATVGFEAQSMDLMLGLTRLCIASAPDLPAKPVSAQSGSSAAAASPENAMLSAYKPNTSSNSPSPIVYTSPVTGISVTRQDLFEYGQGKRTSEHGDIMYFRPSFLDEDPWNAPRKKR